MSECMYPQNAWRTAYKKGCRCLRCLEGTRKYHREYRKKWMLSPTAKASEKVSQDKYRFSQKGKDTRRKYNTSERGKESHKKSKMKFRVNNPLRYKEQQKKKYTKYHTTEKFRESWKRYYRSEKGRASHNSNFAKRKQRMKCNLTKEERQTIRLIYEECQRISKETGILHHVDHIIPLALGGLHHPSNLQILTAEANLKKGIKVTCDAHRLPQPDAHSPCHQDSGSRSPEPFCGHSPSGPYTT